MWPGSKALDSLAKIIRPDAEAINGHWSQELLALSKFLIQLLVGRGRFGLGSLGLSDGVHVYHMTGLLVALIDVVPKSLKVHAAQEFGTFGLFD